MYDFTIYIKHIYTRIAAVNYINALQKVYFHLGTIYFDKRTLNLSQNKKIPDYIAETFTIAARNISY